MRTPRGPLDNRILLTVLAFLGLQVLYFLCVTVLFGLPVPRLAVFAAVAVGYHAAFYLGLQRVRREFNLESTGEPLRRMNLPLLLSFLRLSSVPAVLFLFVSLRALPFGLVVVPFLAAVFLTDLLDGLLARALGQETRIGRIVDAAGDYLLIFAVTILFGVYGLIPWWLVALVLVRLLVQSSGIVTLYRRKGFSSLKLTFLGKVSVFSTFCLYGFELAEHLHVRLLGAPRLVTSLEFVAAGILAASLVDKILFLRRELPAASEPEPGAPARGHGER
jgi:phosphatidylglycerophosphate synthase